MRNFRQLVLTFLFSISGSAFAQVYDVPSTFDTYNNGDLGFASADEACKANAARGGMSTAGGYSNVRAGPTYNNGSSGPCIGEGPYGTTIYSSSPGTDWGFRRDLPPPPSKCPAYGPGPDIRAPAGYEPKLGSSFSSFSSIIPFTSGIYDVKGCGVTPRGPGGTGEPKVKQCYENPKPGANGQYLVSCEITTYYTGDPSPTGAGDPTPPAPTPPSNAGCPSGTSNIGSDSSGTPQCVGNITPPSRDPYKSTTTATNADGSKTTTGQSTTVVTNSDNSTTTTTTTNTTNISSGGQASPTTTTSQSSTAPPKTGAADQNPDTQKDFCALHPDLSLCKTSSVGGSCSSLQCNGDAIQCAALVEQQRLYCESQAPNDLATLGNKMLAGTDETGSNATKSSVIDLGGMTQLDASPFLGGGACMPDQSFTYLGKSLAIPWSKTCDPLAGLRIVVMFLAYFSAYKMLSSVVLKDT